VQLDHSLPFIAIIVYLSLKETSRASWSWLPVISKTSNKTHNAVIVEMGSHILNKFWKENEINAKYSKIRELFNGVEVIL
jgi:hypothetical protein